MSGRRAAEQFTVVRRLPDGRAELKSDRGRMIRCNFLRCVTCSKQKPEWEFRGAKCSSCIHDEIRRNEIIRKAEDAAFREKWEANSANRKSVLGKLGSRRRYARVKQATPVWLDKSQIYEIYEECERITLETGVQHHVDHIWPIFHTDCCGLHVPWNLRVIPARDNVKKSWKLPKVVDENITNQYIVATSQNCS